MEKANYGKFILMLLASFVVMYFVMYSMLASFGHFYFSVSRLYMTFLMIAPMALIMLGFMGAMYTNKKKNTLIVLGGIVVFAVVVVYRQNQTFMGDKAYMKALIPHHSAAILTSENAEISDPQVRELADEIIRAQRREITEMKQILARMENE